MTKIESATQWRVWASGHVASRGLLIYISSELLIKVFDLQCARGHGFEGWFASQDAFDAQLADGLVACPICGDSQITKLLTAPRLNLRADKAQLEGGKLSAADSAEAHWLRAVRGLMSQTEDVGERFVDEARKMHYGETEERGIRGQATPEQARELADEGIPVLTLPLPPALKETLQ